MAKLVINMVPESDLYTQGHGVHTAYDEIASALEGRSDCDLVRGGFGEDINCDVVHLHTIGWKTWPKLMRKSTKKVISAHVIPASLVGSIKGARYWLFAARIYMKWFYNKADKVLAVSEMTKVSLVNELGVPEEKIEVFHNTIGMNRYKRSSKSRVDARKELDIDLEAKVVMGIGQVQPRKRIDTFISMAKAMPEVTFVWVGGIPFKQLGAEYGLMQKMVRNSPSNFIVTDIVPHGDVLRYLHAADVFCLPAEQENHPMCVLEAAGAELPIVLRDIKEYDDTFKGDVIRCNSEEDFIAAIDSLLSDNAKYKHWVRKSNYIRDRFDSSAAAERLMGIYRSLV